MSSWVGHVTLYTSPGARHQLIAIGFSTVYRTLAARAGRPWRRVRPADYPTHRETLFEGTNRVETVLAPFAPSVFFRVFCRLVPYRQPKTRRAYQSTAQLIHSAALVQTRPLVVSGALVSRDPSAPHPCHCDRIGRRTTTAPAFLCADRSPGSLPIILRCEIRRVLTSAHGRTLELWQTLRPHSRNGSRATDRNGKRNGKHKPKRCLRCLRYRSMRMRRLTVELQGAGRAIIARTRQRLGRRLGDLRQLNMKGNLMSRDPPSTHNRHNGIVQTR